VKQDGATLAEGGAIFYPRFSHTFLKSGCELLELALKVKVRVCRSAFFGADGFRGGTA
jgi:hypothetical protein